MKKRKKSLTQKKGQIKTNIFGFYDKKKNLNIFFEVNNDKYRLAEISGTQVTEKIEINNKIKLNIICFSKNSEKYKNIWYEPIDYWYTCKNIKNQDKYVIKEIIEYLVK